MAEHVSLNSPQWLRKYVSFCCFQQTRPAVQLHIDCRYSPAWRSLEPTVGQTAEVLEASVQQVCPDAQLVEWASLPEGEYRAFTVGSLFGRDRLECVFAPS
jgi:hypothetical protein